ncbi:MAG: hypothetical protein QUV05_04785 [Phycisphaerae bacterium]|nr:hypothetical protein [Phycisphaerae bacterium]
MSTKSVKSWAASFVAVLMVASASQLLGQSIIFSDQFDSYIGMNPHLTVASTLWALDGCNDARLDDTVSYVMPGMSAATFKGGSTGEYRLGSRVRHDLTVAEMLNAAVVHDPNPTCVNGTEAHPLGFQYKMHLGPTSSNVYYYTLNLYAELTCGSDRAPTPMVTADCGGKLRPHLILDGDGQPHRSIALGQIAWADSDPCDTTEQVAQMYRLVLYDGRQWKILQTPVDMHTCGAWNIVTMLIKTDSIDIELKSRYDSGTGSCTSGLKTFTTTVTREYKEHFTSLKFGGIPREEGDGGCWGQDNAPANAYPVQDTLMDDVYLYDGEAFNNPNPCAIIPTGACCTDFDCAITTAADCTGDYKGDSTICDTYACCSDPFADYDSDLDVDQADFALFQACFTGTGVFDLQGACKCSDRTDSTGSGPPDFAVDTFDLARFEACASGPGIPADPACD